MLKIRPIHLDDAARFIALRKQVDKSGFMLHEPEERTISVTEQRRNIQQILSAENEILFVAEAEGKLVGFAGLKGRTLKRVQHVGSLYIGVLEDHQGQGIATKLMQTILNWAETAAITKVELAVLKSNTKAQKLYQKFGFIQEGEIIHAVMIDGKPENEYLMYTFV